MNTLKIFVVANPATQNEWAILKSSKFTNALNFNVEFTDDMNDAQIFIWDGIKNIAAIDTYQKIEKTVSTEGHVLLWIRDLDVFENFKTVSTINLDQMRYVELNKTQLKPESMIWALNECKKKLIHV